ncbi:hypothetical protein GCK32_005509, partial [Trichostrongylus colubriformis]
DFLEIRVCSEECLPVVVLAHCLEVEYRISLNKSPAHCLEVANRLARLLIGVDSLLDPCFHIDTLLI